MSILSTKFAHSLWTKGWKVVQVFDVVLTEVTNVRIIIRNIHFDAVND